MHPPSSWSSKQSSFNLHRQPASINCINFSSDSTLLCVASDHGTIHVFAVNDGSRRGWFLIITIMIMITTQSWSSSSPSWSSRNRQLQPPLAAAPFLPKYFSSEWSFSRMEVPGGTRSTHFTGAEFVFVFLFLFVVTFIFQYFNVNEFVWLCDSGAFVPSVRITLLLQCVQTAAIIGGIFLCVISTHQQALTGSRISIPGFFGTGFCQIPGSRDFSGRDFPIFLIPGF